MTEGVSKLGEQTLFDGVYGILWRFYEFSHVQQESTKSSFDALSKHPGDTAPSFLKVLHFNLYS